MSGVKCSQELHPGYPASLLPCCPKLRFQPLLSFPRFPFFLHWPSAQSSLLIIAPRN
jgi:hypothetical protein